MPGAVPVIGKELVSFIRGGEEISSITLTRFFAVHIVILPLITSLFLALHFIMIRKLGISGPL
ncbi:cytochrome b N-terminal domain-containing protein [bacterium]|nr:cytochrome b N-terminal domain-containing protein [bacterium]